MARGNPLITKEKLKEAEGRFDPNLRDEGAGFFSTLFTAGSNLGSDAVTELGYIAQAVARPIDTGEAVLRVLAGYAQKALPNDWEAYLPEDWATNKVYANAINDYYAEKYGSLEQAADSFAEQPISVALDAFAVKALLTTVSKQAAKRSAATTKMANTAKGTVMEGELASRAAAELKVAQELERTVKYEGKLVWDDALGAYVPESSVVKPKIDAAEVAPIIDDIETATRRAQLSPELRAMEDAILVERMNAFSDPNFTLVGSTTIAEEAAKRMASSKEGMITGTRNQTVAPALTDDAARISDEAFAEDYRKYIEERANQPLDDFEGVGAYITEDFPSKTGGVEFGASLAKQRADKQRMDDDAAMAAAIQDDLFTNASPAAYENYQASRLAALADDTALATTAPKGMITSRAAGPISRTKDIDIPPPPSVPKLTAKPESASRPAKDLEINLSRTLPAAQRIAAAASQTGLQGERGADGSSCASRDYKE